MGHSPNDAAEKDAQIMFRKEECALDMGQRLSPNDAAEKDAQILSRKEECVLGMGQTSIDAAEKDAHIVFRKEECSRYMGQRLNRRQAEDEVVASKYK